MGLSLSLSLTASPSGPGRLEDPLSVHLAHVRDVDLRRVHVPEAARPQGEAGPDGDAVRREREREREREGFGSAECQALARLAALAAWRWCIVAQSRHACSQGKGLLQSTGVRARQLLNALACHRVAHSLLVI